MVTDVHFAQLLCLDVKSSTGLIVWIPMVTDLTFLYLWIDFKEARSCSPTHHLLQRTRSSFKFFRDWSE